MTDRIQCKNRECRKEFIPKLEGQRYCSKKCRRIRKECPNCKKVFRMKRINQKYCSKECRLKTWFGDRERVYMSKEEYRLYNEWKSLRLQNAFLERSERDYVTDRGAPTQVNAGFDW
jgi:hypothetical protein